MKKILRSLLPQQFINNFYHLPKAILANVIYGFPTRRLKVKGLTVIGVTGTDGKTTTVNMIYQVLKDAGKKVSMVSTVNAVVGRKSYDTGFHVTSPDPFLVQKFARDALDNKDEYLVLEVTSHALDQYRFWGIKFGIGVITNITHEHLDYHQTFENYFNTKTKLIERAKFVIVNQNLKEKLKKNLGKEATFGLNKGDFNQNDVKLKLKVPGDYNVENALAALAVTFTLDIDRKSAQKTLENFVGVKGRMEEIKNSRGIKIIIDFAHTPNALEQALKTLRKQTKGKLISVFGRAGQRDIQMRPMLGEISAKLADITVITTEDPRGELGIISKQIMDGAIKAGAKLNKNLFVINDRGEAIEFAINNLAKKGDLVGIFGKGHESSMNLDGKEEIPWSDFEAVNRALRVKH